MTTNSVKEFIINRIKTRILVKSREELQKILDEFCLTYKDGFPESGICSEKAIRESTGYRYDLFAGRELDAEKTFYAEGYDFQGFNYDYRVEYIGPDNKTSIFPIFPDEIVREI